MIALIAAAAENNALGKDNQMMWHLPDDFKRFKQLTTGHPIIMGRKTFESFPKLLPNRKHIIITRRPDYHPADCIVVNSIEAAIKAAQSDTIYIIGGGEIYHLALPFADVIELTRVHASFDADAYFPEINMSEWQLQSSEYHPKDERHAIDFTYETFDRIG
jgi:dihydrofolate reductase